MSVACLANEARPIAACEADLKPTKLPKLHFPVRESTTAPHGYVVVSFTIDTTGSTADAKVIESKATPDDHWFNAAALEYVRSLNYPRRTTVCHTQMKVRFDQSGDRGA
jgi:TonB family protein